MYKSDTMASPIKKENLFFYPLKLGMALWPALDNGIGANAM